MREIWHHSFKFNLKTHKMPLFLNIWLRIVIIACTLTQVPMQVQKLLATISLLIAVMNSKPPLMEATFFLHARSLSILL